MATIARTAPAALQREQQFFFAMACFLAVVVFAGFSLALGLGVTSFAVPLDFHLHAFAFFGWVVLFTLQSGLVARGSFALHRRLGMVSILLLPAMAGTGLNLIVVSFRMGMIPPFYDLREFLFGVIAQLLGFLALAIAGLALRKQSDWHRRLLICAMAFLAKAGWDRLLPVPLFGPFAWWSGAFATYLIPIAGMAFDKWNRGRVHRAWIWGVTIMAFAHISAFAVASTDMADAAVSLLVRGSAGEERPHEAFLP